MRRCLFAFLLGLLILVPARTQGQSADDLTKLIEQLIELDSNDLSKSVKFRSGLEPSLYAVDADEAQMTVLKDPFTVHGQGKPGAAGWYRVRFTVPERIGKFPMPKNGYTCGVETNVLGAWETYTYVNGKPAGLWSKDGMMMAANQRPTWWMSSAPMPIKPGDDVQVAILAMASPLGRGSPEGYGLRHLRLRFAYSHTAGRAPFYGSVSAPGMGSGLLGVREKLATLKGDELEAFRVKLKDPLARLEAVFKAAETEKLEVLTKAMLDASKDLNDAMKK
ncbi:MAG: hypothetical protein JNM56_02850 [Planctomycetia bacterium]|nr:hypothetical protein [Planctomycetia bacterium]